MVIFPSAAPAIPLGAYNGGEAFIRSLAWAEYLLNTAPNAGLLSSNGNPQPVRGRYSIKIRRDANLPRRSYAIEWRSVTADEAALYQNVSTGDYVCYWFSEDDWYGSNSTFGVQYTNIQTNLNGLNDNRVINCATGQALTNN